MFLPTFRVSRQPNLTAVYDSLCRRTADAGIVPERIGVDIPSNLRGACAGVGFRYVAIPNAYIHSGTAARAVLGNHQPVADRAPSATDVKEPVTARQIIEYRPQIDRAGCQGIYRALARMDPLQADSSPPRGFLQDFESRPTGPAIGRHELAGRRLFVAHAERAAVPIRLAASPYRECRCQRHRSHREQRSVFAHES
jgi:hypothetical protein